MPRIVWVVAVVEMVEIRVAMEVGERKVATAAVVYKVEEWKATVMVAAEEVATTAARAAVLQVMVVEEVWKGHSLAVTGVAEELAVAAVQAMAVADSLAVEGKEATSEDSLGEPDKEGKGCCAAAASTRSRTVFRLVHTFLALRCRSGFHQISQNRSASPLRALLRLSMATTRHACNTLHFVCRQMDHLCAQQCA